jgi:hypothetical protein
MPKRPLFIRALFPLWLSLFFSSAIPALPAQEQPFPGKESGGSIPHLDEAEKSLEEGRSTLESGPLTAAQQAYEACANSETANFECFFNLAKVYYYMTFMHELNRHRDDAKKSLDKGLQWGLKAEGLNGQSPEIHALLADMYVRKILLGDLFTPMDCGPKGGAEKDKAVKLDPDNPQVLAMLGRCALFAPPLFGGDVKKAIIYFNQSLKVDPQSDETYFWLAKAYRQQKDRISFEKAIQEALRLNPKNVLAQKELESWPLKPAK